MTELNHLRRVVHIKERSVAILMATVSLLVLLNLVQLNDLI